MSIWASCLGKDTELGAFTSIRLDASDGSKVGANEMDYGSQYDRPLSSKAN